MGAPIYQMDTGQTKRNEDQWWNQFSVVPQFVYFLIQLHCSILGMWMYWMLMVLPGGWLWDIDSHNWILQLIVSQSLTISQGHRFSVLTKWGGVERSPGRYLTLWSHNDRVPTWEVGVCIQNSGGLIWQHDSHTLDMLKLVIAPKKIN
jgi:hypothetical protein